MRFNLEEETKKARRISFGIGLFGIVLLGLFNWNSHLLYYGNKYESTVVSIYKKQESCYRITTEFVRKNGEKVQNEFTDCTGETFLFWIDEGDVLEIWESKNKPYRYYVPFVNFAAKIFLLIFFILGPFAAAIFGRY